MSKPIPFPRHIALVLAVACGLSAASTGLTQTAGITVWAPSAGIENDHAKAVVAEWNKTQAVQVKLEAIPNATTSEEVILAAIAAKNTPDVLVSATPLAVPQYVAGGGLLSLDKEFKDAESYVTQRSGKATLDQYRSANGSLNQVPWRANPVMTFYNKKLFVRAGLNPSAPPKTYSEYLAALAKLKAAGVTGITQSIDQTWWHRFFDLYPTYLAAANRLYLNKEGTKAAFNTPAARGVLEFWRKVYSAGYAPKSAVTPDQNNPFMSGRSAMFIAGPWAIPLMKSSGVLPDVGVTTVPAPDALRGRVPNTFGDTKSIVIFASTRNKAASWEFVKFYTSRKNDALWLRLTSQIPLRQDLKSELGADFFKQNPLLETFLQQGQRTLNTDTSPKLVDVFTALSTAYQAGAIYATKSVDQALRDAEAEVNKLLGGQ